MKVIIFLSVVALAFAQEDVSKEPTKDICQLPPETGPCRARIERYYFNTSTGMCQNFTYGGCEGNSNNFNSSEECEKRCGCPKIKCPSYCHTERNHRGCPTCVCDSTPPEECCSPNEEYSMCVNPCNNCEIKGKCNFLVCNPGCDCKSGYYRNRKGCCIPERECPAEVCGENQVFNCCGTACPKTCANYEKPPEICTLQCVMGCMCKKGYVKTCDGRCVQPEECYKNNTCVGEAVTGPCKASMPRWYYNEKTKQCEKFIYGGCGGNKNRYCTEEECKKKCAGKVA